MILYEYNMVTWCYCKAYNAHMHLMLIQATTEYNSANPLILIPFYNSTRFWLNSTFSHKVFRMHAKFVTSLLYLFRYYCFCLGQWLPGAIEAEHVIFIRFTVPRHVKKMSSAEEIQSKVKWSAPATKTNNWQRNVNERIKVHFIVNVNEFKSSTPKFPSPHI